MKWAFFCCEIWIIEKTILDKRRVESSVMEVYSCNLRFFTRAAKWSVYISGNADCMNQENGDPYQRDAFPAFVCMASLHTHQTTDI